MPEIEVTSNARPSLFGYPPKLEEKKDKSREKVETAVLSITAKQKKKKGERASTTDAASDSNKSVEKMDTVIELFVIFSVHLYIIVYVRVVYRCKCSGLRHLS